MRHHSSLPFRILRVLGLAASLTFAGWGVALAGGDELFTPLHVSKLKSVTDTAISPDGKHIAYALSVPRIPFGEDDGPAWAELHVVDAEGNSRPYVTGKVNVSGIQWTRDGKLISYLAKRGEDKHKTLYVIPVDGGESRCLVRHEESITRVAFCPTDSRIAFLAKSPRSEEEEANRGKGFNQEVYEENLRPTRVWIADSESDAPPRAIQLKGSASHVEWSPDGKKLVVVLAPTPLVDDSYMFKQVRVISAQDGHVLDRIEHEGKLGDVRFAPDGRHLAMIAGVDIHDPREGRLMIVSLPVQGKPVDLMPDLDGHIRSMQWKDANTLVWIAGEHQDTRVGTVSVDGEQETLVAPGDVVLDDVSTNQNGDIAAFVGQTPKFPSSVIRLRLGARPDKLTDANPWLEKMRFARQEVVKWKARDGLDLEGVLVYPLDYEEGRRYPLILTVHGGPESHVSNGWVTSYSYAGQTAAARGFAVFYPNYRGSTGRGVEFSKMGQADAAGREFDDLIDAIDHLVAEGIVDKDRVGITGGSYGGYASAWGATYYSDRYAASVMFVGISDNISKVGTTDIPEEMFLVHHRKRLWDDWEYYLQRSPIRHVEKNQTPTLILHGKNDPRVHPSQSLELFRHLKTLKQAPARLVLYEGEGHGNRKAAARFDYNLRMRRWMEHYLQGPGGNAPEFKLNYKTELGVGD